MIALSSTRTAASRRRSMVKVGAYPTRSEAELAPASLAPVLAADDARGADPLNLAGSAQLLVDEAGAEEDRPPDVLERLAHGEEVAPNGVHLSNDRTIETSDSCLARMNNGVFIAVG
jgi:hypothetical protein